MRAFRRQADIDKTKTGLLLLIIGTVLSPIEYLNIPGVLIILVGALLVILGRKSFGDVHSRNTIVSAIVYIVGATAVSLGAIGVFAAEFEAGSPAANSGSINAALFSQSLGNAFQAFLIATAVGGAIIGLAQVLFTYALQIQTGKIFLWLGYFSTIVVSVVEAVMMPPIISNAALRAQLDGLSSPAFGNLQSQLLLVGLLGFIPALFYANAFYLARERIERKEIPETRPRQYSRIGAFFDDSRYLLAVFSKFMMPIVVLAALWLVLVTFYHH